MILTIFHVSYDLFAMVMRMLCSAPDLRNRLNPIHLADITLVTDV